jgi:hypothetical protein
MAQPTKKQKRLTKYSLEYQKEYPFIKACSSSLKDHLYKFHCSSCNVNISCAHGGISDVREHIATSNHKTAHRNCQSKFNPHGHVVLEVISNIYHQQLLGSLGGSKDVQTLSLRNLISLEIHNQ